MKLLTKKKVLLACVENWHTLQELPFVVKSAGCTVDVFCSKNSWLRRNSFHDRFIEKVEGPGWRDQLKALAKDYDWVVPGDEKVLAEMNHHLTDEALAHRILPLRKLENRYIIASKRGLSQFCEENSILSPRSIYYTTEETFSKESKKLSFPVLVKLDLSWGGRGIKLCQTHELLKHAISSIDNKSNLLVQEFIEGKDIGIEALYKNGELLEYTAAEIITYSKGPFSTTTRRNCYTSKAIETVLRETGKKIGAHGFASIQLIEREDRFYLIEFDLRPNIWVAYDRFAGHDFTTAVRKFLDDRVVSNDAIAVSAGKTEVAIFYRDITRSIEQKDVRGLLQWLTNRNRSWKFIPFYDKKLFCSIFYELFTAQVADRLLRKTKQGLLLSRYLKYRTTNTKTRTPIREGKSVYHQTKRMSQQATGRLAKAGQTDSTSTVYLD